MKRMLQFFVVFILLVPAFTPKVAASQGGSAASKSKRADAPKETMQGTIDYMKQLGGYFIRGVNPGGEFFIVNQNPKVLKALKDSGKTVTLQGYTSNQGAEYFFIERINGKRYKGAAANK
jgi:hypothetical protein